MHKNFAEWYRLVRIEPNGDVLKNRWGGVEEWSESLPEQDDAVLETVRIFQGLPEVTSREPFLAVFRKHDPAFQQRDNEFEQRLLAGATLVHTVTTHDSRTAVLSGSALAASRLRVEKGPLEEIIGEVVAGLHEVARKLRRRKGLNSHTLSSSDVTQALETAATDITGLRRGIGAALTACLSQVQRALDDTSHDLRCADEETNILWWLEGGYSRDLNRPWSVLRDEAPIIAGWELADLTDVALGPRDVAAFLKRVLSSIEGLSEDQSLHAYVNAVSDDWAKTRTCSLPDHPLDLAPLSRALSQRAKGGRSSWQQFFAKTGGIDPMTPLAAEKVATQAYLEAVLLRTLAITKD